MSGGVGIWVGGKDGLLRDYGRVIVGSEVRRRLVESRDCLCGGSV